jgi:ribonuclease HI
MAKKNSVYAVANGRSCGLFATWGECKEQVDGFRGARYKGFTNRAEAQEWLDENSSSPRPHNVDHIDYTIYTDGSCLRNPDGPGGWAVVAKDESTGAVTEQSGGNPSTTNNRMELTAAIKALSFTPAGACIALYTDSQYLKNGLTSWVAGWKRRKWKKSDGSPVMNKDLWQELDSLARDRNIIYHWVKGHAGISLNERCDVLAKRAAINAKKNWV